MNKKFEILIVDDIPQNLKLLIEILNDKNFHIRVFSSPEQSMKSIEKKVPDLILLDINMPKITGFQFATFLKSNVSYKEIPIIFITASNSIEDKLKAFKLGGVDYITKPFQVEEVLARVNAQLTISHSRNELEEALNLTLHGSVSLLTDILSFINPEIFNKSIRLKKYTKDIVEELNLKNKWIYEISAMVSQLGYLSIPEHIIIKKTFNRPLSEEEEMIYEKYKETGSEMIGRIPKLELVSLILLQDYERAISEKELNEKEKFIVKTGTEILKLIIDYDDYKCQKKYDFDIEKILKRNKSEYNETLLKTFLGNINKTSTNFIQKKLFIHELEIDMITLEDIISDKGIKILAKDTVLTENILHLLEMYADSGVITRQIRVSIIAE